MIYGLDAANLTSLRIQTVFNAVGGDLARIALTLGLARGLLAPTRPNWRLPPISDTAAARLVRAVVSVAGILLITRFCEALNDVIDASLAFSVATRALGALLAAMALAFGLWRVGADAADADCLGPRVTRRQNWFAILRGLALAAALVVVVAVLAGYPTFASFFLDQVIWVSGVATVFFMASLLVEEAIGNGFKPKARFGNWLVNRVGLQRNSLELLGVVLSGALRLAFFLVAIVAALAPWGLQQADVPFNLRAAFFGFKVGDVVVSPASIIVAIAIFGLIWAAVHTLQRWLDGRLLPHTGLDAALRNSITTSLGYVGFILAAGFAFGYLGLSFDKLAIVAGALSVGIGFGLQSIINNFVSGLILLWERAVRVGDWIIVGGDQGFVRRINIRSTEIETVRSRPGDHSEFEPDHRRRKKSRPQRPHRPRRDPRHRRRSRRSRKGPRGPLRRRQRQRPRSENSSASDLFHRHVGLGAHLRTRGFHQRRRNDGPRAQRSPFRDLQTGQGERFLQRACGRSAENPDSRRRRTGRRRTRRRNQQKNESGQDPPGITIATG